jgi:hypothetical protein
MFVRLFIEKIFICFRAVSLLTEMNSSQARNSLLIFNETIDCWEANLAYHGSGGW